MLLKYFSLCTQVRLLHENEVQMQHMKQQVNQVLSSGNAEAADPAARVAGALSAAKYYR
jgi:hypothetical protein